MGATTGTQRGTGEIFKTERPTVFMMCLYAFAHDKPANYPFN